MLQGTKVSRLKLVELVRKSITPQRGKIIVDTVNQNVKTTGLGLSFDVGVCCTVNQYIMIFFQIIIFMSSWFCLVLFSSLIWVY
jgi:hypothetical protein